MPRTAARCRSRSAPLGRATGHHEYSPALISSRLWVMTTGLLGGTSASARMFIQTNVDAYRKLRNTTRWMLGHARLTEPRGRRGSRLRDMPELSTCLIAARACRTRRDLVGGGGGGVIDNFDFKRHRPHLARLQGDRALGLSISISASDTLYCDAPSSTRRKAAIVVVMRLLRQLW